MKEEHLKKIILFYFFVTLNEGRSKELARKSWQWCRKRKAIDPKTDPNKLVLLALHNGWEKLKKESRSGVAHYSLDSGWRLPKGVSLEPWKAFQKNATDEEIFITVISRILSYSLEAIVEGLGLSEGTIRYRLARASRKMGAFVAESGAP